MTPQEKQNLRELAEKAHQGDWDIEDPCGAPCGTYCTPDGCHENHPTGLYEVYGPENFNDYGNSWYSKEDASYIAAAHPQVILSLLDENEELKKNTYLADMHAGDCRRGQALQTENDELRSKLVEAEMALEFYANRSHWTTNDDELLFIKVTDGDWERRMMAFSLVEK